MFTFDLKLLGNSIIILSLLGFILLFSPYILSYFPPPAKQKALTDSFVIDIPKIGAHSLIIPQIDPWNEAEYQKALKIGVAQAKDTSYPNEKGTLYIFAHSSAPPWEILWTHPVFLRLGELKNDDMITITYKKKEYRYKVIGQKVVSPWETEYLTRDAGYDLILQTCTPLGTALQRLLVFAEKIN